jgi:hypothetical protein
VRRTVRLVLVGVVAVAGLILWSDILIRAPTIAAIIAAIVLAFLDWWRRRRRLQARKDE